MVGFAILLDYWFWKIKMHNIWIASNRKMLMKIGHLGLTWLY